MTTNATRTSRHVNAPRASLYRALVDAHAVATWMVPSGMTSHVQVVVEMMEVETADSVMCGEMTITYTLTDSNTTRVRSPLLPPPWVSSPISAQSSRDRVLDDRRIKVMPHVNRALPGSVGLFAIGLKRTALIGHFLRAPAIVENVVTDQIARRVVGVGLDDAELECDVAQIGV